MENHTFFQLLKKIGVGGGCGVVGVLLVRNKKFAELKK